MKKIIIWLVVIIVIVIGAVWLLNRNGGSTAAAPMIPATNQAVVLNTATNATLGTYLVATNGMTLYQYSKDTAGVSNCTGQCATAWPPYTVGMDAPLAGATGLTGTISTLMRADGTMQVEYNGMPLYLWQGDAAAGDTTGQNVNGFTVLKP